MKRLFKLTALLLALATLMCIIPFAIAADGSKKTYKLPIKVITGDVIPVSSEKFIGIGAELYGADGAKIASMPKNENILTIKGNYVFTEASVSLTETGLDAVYNSYTVVGGILSKIKTYECHNSVIIPYDGGSVTFLVHVDLEKLSPYHYDVIDENGKSVYSSGISGIKWSVFDDDLIALGDNDGKNVLISGFTGTLISKEIPGELQGNFTNGLAPFTVDGNFSAKYYGIINTAGEVVAEAKYAMAHVLDNGYAVLYDKYATREGCGEGIHVIDFNGKVVFEDMKNTWDIIAYFGDTYIALDPFLTYGFMRVGESKPIAYKDYYYSELDYHFFANNETSLGNLYDTDGNLVLKNISDFSTDGKYITAKPDSGRSYVIFDTEGTKLFTYSSSSKFYALTDGLAVGYYSNDSAFLTNGDRKVTDTHDYYLGGEVYDELEVYLFADENETNGELTYTTYFIEDSFIPFTDVAANYWATNAIVSAYENGIMEGTGGLSFSPKTEVTRAQVVTILWRMAGSEYGGFTTTRFDDVVQDKWYHKAISWAWLKGIANGVGDGKFAPDRPITRSELATLLYRYADVMDLDTTAKADISSFPDSGKVEAWAMDGMRWCVANGLINGKTEGAGKAIYLAPSDKLTRAEIAAVVSRFDLD